jgi:hypothetical protein
MWAQAKLLTGQWWASLQDVVAALQIISYIFGLTGYRITVEICRSVFQHDYYLHTPKMFQV